MFRKLFCTVLALGTALALAAPASAAGEETGSIRVTLQNGESVVPDGSVTLYRVGSLVDGDYWLTAEFGGGMVRTEDAMSPALAAWLAESAADGGLTYPLDAEGSAEFAGLRQGLYLIVQEEASTGYHKMEPMTVMMPCQYQWYVQAYPKTQEIVWAVPATGQPIAPYIGAAGMVLSAGGLGLCARKKRRA